MSPSTSFKPEWIEKARIDYFPHFMTLWISVNSWYKSIYEHNQDRQCINAIKNDFTIRNNLFSQFTKLMSVDTNKDSLKFKSDLEGLFYALNSANISYADKGKDGQEIIMSFNRLLIDFSKRRDVSKYVNIMTMPSRSLTSEETPPQSIIKLDSKYIIDDNEIVFAGLIEVIYQMRCHLFHGNLDAESDYHHDVVKYCYEILFALMNF